MSKSILNVAIVLLLLSISLNGCATPTVGQQFRDIMAQIDADCRRDKLGPYLDKNDPDYMQKRARTDCDVLKVKPVDPLATEEGRLAYSIQLPPPYDKPQVRYRTGMSAETYFKELCEKAEGDFVFRTVDGVDGIKIMRPKSDVSNTPPLWAEYGWLPPGYLVAPINGTYEYVDAVEMVKGSQTETHMTHYFVDPKLPYRVPPFGLGSYTISKSNARYGYTFRKSSLENQELGIVGDEIIILDLETNEVLAFRRRFSRLNFMTRQSVQPMQGTPCRLLNENLNDKFIARILKPAAHAKGDSK